MKVALINPKGTIFSRNKRLAAFLERSVTMGSFRHFWSAPCLGLLVVAAYCPDEWQLCYIDENQRPVDFGVRYDLVLISAMTVQAKRAYEIADAFRRTGTPVVMGGIHATVMPEEALAHVDAVLAGEGEVLFPQLIEDLVHGRRAGFIGRKRPVDSTLRSAAPLATTCSRATTIPSSIYTPPGAARENAPFAARPTFMECNTGEKATRKFCGKWLGSTSFIPTVCCYLLTTTLLCCVGRARSCFNR